MNYKFCLQNIKFIKNFLIYHLWVVIKLLFNLIINLSNFKRRIVLYCIDFLILFLIFFYISWLSDVNDFLFLIKEYKVFFILFVLTFLPFNLLTNKYKTVSKYVNSYTLYKYVINNLLFLLSLVVISLISDFKIIPAKTLSHIFFLLTIIQAFSRIFIRDYLAFISKNKYFNAKKTLIYGAGSAGAKLLPLLDYDKNINVVGYLDDNKSLWNRELNGKRIYNPNISFEKLNDIEQVFIAIPSISKNRFKEICSFLENKKVNVQKVPLLDEILYKSKNIDDLRPIKEEDLLGRDPVKPDIELLKKSIKGKVIAIIGAGGSIGSELALQILKLDPSIIILVDIDEHSSYQIDQLMKENNKKNIKIDLFLGDIKFEPFLNNIFEAYKIDVVFHAAAYKHVPLLEKNVFEGMRNNIFGTLNLCKKSIEYKVKKIILISTDKAVRPSNIMGCSKRICELIFLSFQEIAGFTKFSIVRFGNVLGSSGSVVPLFRKQLKSGGPITLTHKNVKRYFMTISEAAQLVIQTTSLTSGKDIFLLDMGDPVFIFDLAKRMINLSGFELKDENNKNGDIEIKFLGLRDGEKMNEELLIGSNSSPTIHPLIYRASEDVVMIKNIENILKKLYLSIEKNDKKTLNKIIMELVPESTHKDF